MNRQTNDRFLRRHDMLARVGIPQATVYLMMQRGEFPRSYRITRRLVGWRESEIVDWMASRPGYVHRPQSGANLLFVQT